MSVPTDQNGTRHARYARRRREQLAGFLKPIDPDDPDGPKVSTHPDCPHGHRDGYDLYGCRCPKCGEQSAAPRIREYREQRYQAAAVAVLRRHGVPEGQTVEDLADTLIEVWRTSRGESRIRKLAVRIRKAGHAATSPRAITMAEELTSALRAAGAGARAAREPDGAVPPPRS